VMSVIPYKIGIPYATYFSEVSKGGIQNFVRIMGSEVPDNIEITYFGIGSRPDFLRSTDNWIKIMDVNDALNKGNLNIKFAFMLRRFADELGSLDLLIHQRPESAMFSKSSKNVLMMHTGSSGGIRTRGLLRGTLLFLFEILAAKKSIQIIAVNPSAVSRLTSFLCRNVVGTRVPLNPIFNQSISPPLNKRILSVSRIEKEKGIDGIIWLADKAHLPIFFLGSGSYELKAKELCKRKKVEAYFLGYLTAQEIAQEFRQGGIFVNMSKNEGYPLSCIEALASGIPVLGLQDTPGIYQLEEFGMKLFANKEALLQGILKNPAPNDIQKVRKVHLASSIASTYWKKIEALLLKK